MKTIMRAAAQAADSDNMHVKHLSHKGLTSQMHTIPLKVKY